MQFLAQELKQGSFCLTRCPSPGFTHSLRQKLVRVWSAQRIFCSSSLRLLKFIELQTHPIPNSGSSHRQQCVEQCVMSSCMRQNTEWMPISISAVQMMLQSPIYPQERYRYVIGFVYIITALVNSLPVHTFSSINVIVENTFHITPLEVTLNALLFTIAHPLFAFPCNWVLNKYGMRISFICGGVLVVAGVWLRLLLEVENPLFCLMGSALAAIGNIFILNTPSKVALNWFATERVPIVTFTGILATLISLTIGASIPGFLIKEDSTPEQIKEFLFIEACVVTVPYIFLMILFREKPQFAPSKAANATNTKEREKYKSLLKKLFSNKQYLKLMVAMTLNYGTLTALLMVLDQTLNGIGYTDSGEKTSVTILSAMLLGILSNPIFSFLLRSTKAYKAVAMLNTLGGFIMATLLLLGFLFKITNTGELIFLGGIAGFFLIPLPSILITFASEIVFPIDESSSAGYLFASSQTFGFLIGFFSIQILDSTFETSKLVIIIFCGLLFLSFLMTTLVKEDLRKWRYENASEIKINSKLEDSLIIKDSKFI